jgi:ABC-type transport system involved in multi-copper enzyme maturation permease subunit
MFIPPVIERELRAALHRRSGTKSRLRVAKIGVAIAVFFMFVSVLIPWASWSQNLHLWFFYWGLYLAIAPPIRISLGLFSQERRNRTLELIYLTGVTSGELFLGKLVGGILIASADLLALVPLLALPFLISGISLNLYFATVACLPALFLFCVAAGVLASVLFKDEAAAFIFMIFLAVAVNLVIPIPFYLGRVLSGIAPFSDKWLCLSPAYAPYLVMSNFGVAGPIAFWRTILAIFAWSGLCLTAAVLFLSRHWREDVRGGVQSAWRGSWKAWLYGAPSRRAALKNALLPANPFQWLIQQDRRPVLAGYSAIGLVCAVWLLGWRAWPQTWPSNPNFFLTAMVFIVLVNWLTMFTAARRIGTDRRDGMLELVLTTPASPEEIVDGEVRALEA